MSRTEIFGLLAGVMLAMMTCVEVLPVKINPWGWLLGELREAITGEIKIQLDNLSSEVKGLGAEMKHQQAESCLARIIRFGDELLHDTLHSKEHFDQILLDIAIYEHFCQNNPEYANGVAGLTIARIKQVYAECLKEHNFL